MGKRQYKYTQKKSKNSEKSKTRWKQEKQGIILEHNQSINQLSEASNERS